MDASEEQITSSTQKLKYVPSLDSLRGYAVLMVLLVHGANRFFIGGWVGVDLFFVISGYLITSLLIGEYNKYNDISLVKFYTRRFLRLLPALFTGVLLANILWSYSGFENSHRLKATLAALFYFTNFIKDVPGNLIHLWSLAVEEHFYIFWPVLVLFFLFRLGYKKQIWFVVVLLLAVTAFRLYLGNVPIDIGPIHIDSYHSTFCRIDCILLGVIMAIVLSHLKQANVNFIRPQNDNALLALYGVLFVAVMFLVAGISPWSQKGGFIATNLLCAFTVLFAVQHPQHPFFLNKAILWVGKRSYGIYVYHYPIFLFFTFKNGPQDIKTYIIITLLRFGLTFIIAALSFKYIEQPILNYKKRFEVN